MKFATVLYIVLALYFAIAGYGSAMNTDTISYIVDIIFTVALSIGAYISHTTKPQAIEETQ